MSRLARLVIPGLPHHITQRGNGGSRVFFSDADYEFYMALLADSCAAARVKCLAFALTPNHIHAILVPAGEDGLRAALAPVHRRYAGVVNARRNRTGHFWQGRYGAAVMDEDHLAACFRHMMMAPVRAGLATSPARWPWLSAAAFLKGAHDGLTDTAAMLLRLPDVTDALAADRDLPAIRDDETVGRPLGSKAFMARIERRTGKSLEPRRRGPKPAAARKFRALSPN